MRKVDMRSMRNKQGNTAVINAAFKGLDKDAIDMLKRFGVKKQYPPNSKLCQEGEPADTFFVLTEGRVVISKSLDNDEDFVVGVLTKGAYFGEIALIAPDGKRTATVTTLLPSEVIEITKEQFDQVFANSPAMARNLLETMINIIRETDQRAINDLEERNQALAQAYADLEAAQEHRIARAALEAQLTIAGQAQRSLLPTYLPEIDGYDFAAQFRPARHVAGDFYDVRELPNGMIRVLIADVSDKGPHAALFMAVTRTLFLTEGQHYDDLVEVVTAVHEGLLSATDYDMFVTVIYGQLDPQTGIFRYVRAGHEEPAVLRGNGDIVQLAASTGRFLGLWNDPAPVFEESSVQLYPGDILMLFSDGVTDMRNPQGQPFGRQRLFEHAHYFRSERAVTIADGVLQQVTDHQQSQDAFDDFTLVVVKVDE